MFGAILEVRLTLSMRCITHTIAATFMSDKTEHPPVPEAFAALGVRPSILRALAEAKFETPSEIQSC